MLPTILSFRDQLFNFYGDFHPDPPRKFFHVKQKNRFLLDMKNQSILLKKIRWKLHGQII